ncbi:MAG: DUF4177 domain-containing protein [Rhodobacteraceae bacterium]|nr:DUF4177 domain-containing protein [Paracoccaceae bacterium]
MQSYEYKVVTAPNRSEKVAGAKTPSDRFAATLAQAMNALARDGWEYVRADTLPSEERSGFTKRTTVYHTVLVFRRPVPAAPDTLTLATEQRFRALSAEAPAGKAPAIRTAPAHAAPRLGAAAGGPDEDL